MELPKFRLVSFVSLRELEKVSGESLESDNFLGLGRVSVMKRLHAPHYLQRVNVTNKALFVGHLAHDIARKTVGVHCGPCELEKNRILCDLVFLCTTMSVISGMSYQRRFTCLD